MLATMAASDKTLPAVIMYNFVYTLYAGTALALRLDAVHYYIHRKQGLAKLGS